MSRKKNLRVRALMQRGVSLADARAEARTSKRRKPYCMVDAATSKTIQVLSVRESRARRSARLYGAQARLVRT